MLEELVAAFIERPDVTYGTERKGFGSRALRVNEKIFAMLDVTGRFVVKLPRERVDALVAAGRGAPFQLGTSRVMKEWVVVLSPGDGWLSLAEEAYSFVKG